MQKKPDLFWKFLIGWFICTLPFIAVFLMQSPTDWVNDYALVPSLVWNGEKIHTLFSYAFLHSNDFHLSINMILLFPIGSIIIRSSPNNVGGFAMICAGTAGSVYAIENPDGLALRGASGIVAGVWVYGLYLEAKCNLNTTVKIASIFLAFLGATFFIWDFVIRFNVPPIDRDASASAHFGGLCVGLVAIAIHAWQKSRSTQTTSY